MEFFIKEARDLAGLTQKELAAIIGVAPNTFHGYESGKHDPKSDLLIKIATACNVSVDFLLGQTQNKKSALSDDRTQKAASKFYRLDEHGKEVVEVVLDVESARVQEAQQFPDASTEIRATLPIWTITDTEVIRLPLLYQSRSAGGGDFADDETTENVDVRLSDITRRADYLIRVNGESMQPDYPDGCIVAVRFQADIELGQVGVFVSSGDSYIKRRGADRLESINPKCPDVIPISDTVCRGLVLGVVSY